MIALRPNPVDCAPAEPPIPDPAASDRVLLAHGGGGELMNELIRRHLLPRLDNDRLAPLADGAVLDVAAGSLVFTTDSFVVTPLEFLGGDIGRLAVAGTVNDLAVMGARPLALSLGLILEEGLPTTTLDRIIRSVAETAREAGVPVVTGDTKVIEHRGGAAGLFINTAGIGVQRADVRLGIHRVQPGDAILLSGLMAEHGLAVMSVRNGIEFESPLRSDAAPLNGLVERLLDSGCDVRFMRDPTRGGVAGVLADVSEGAGLSLEIDETALPIRPTARHAAEMLGLDPLTIANEGKLLVVVAGPDAARALAVLRAHPLGRHAVQIGIVAPTEPCRANPQDRPHGVAPATRRGPASPPLVELLTRSGGRRIIQRPYGEELPRIC